LVVAEIAGWFGVCGAVYKGGILIIFRMNHVNTIIILNNEGYVL
jgi:hypothetical protein